MPCIFWDEEYNICRAADQETNCVGYVGDCNYPCARECEEMDYKEDLEHNQRAEDK